MTRRCSGLLRCYSPLTQSSPGGIGDAFTANKSSRPYTTFELDQIRQHAKRYARASHRVHLFYNFNLDYVYKFIYLYLYAVLILSLIHNAANVCGQRSIILSSVARAVTSSGGLLQTAKVKSLTDGTLAAAAHSQPQRPAPLQREAPTVAAENKFSVGRRL